MDRYAQLFILVIFSKPSITSHAESLPQHCHLHHSNYDWSTMGILSNLYQRIPEFQKQNPYHPHPRNLFDDVDDLADSTAFAYQLRKSTTA